MILCVDHVAGLVITVLIGWLLMGLVILKVSLDRVAAAAVLGFVILNNCLDCAATPRPLTGDVLYCSYSYF